MQTLHTVSKAQLLKIHNRKIAESGDEGINYDTERLLSTLGGIENVLSLLLCSNDTQLSEYELSRIKNIIDPISDDSNQDQCCLCIAKYQ